MGKFSRSWQIMGASWKVLEMDKELLVFPVPAVLAAAPYLLLSALVQSTLQAIYQAAVYRYASEGRAPEGFDERMLAGSFRRK